MMAHPQSSLGENRMPNQPARLIRSWMFVPGHRQKMIEKALSLPALDAVMLDLEDGVAPAEKQAARDMLASSLDQLASGNARKPAVYARINAIGGKHMINDLAAVVRPGLDGLVLPKINTPEEIETVEELLDRMEPEKALARNSTRLLVAIESPRGVVRALELAAASPRVVGLALGAEDFAREMGLPLQRDAEARALLYVRSAIACAAAAANVQAVDAVWTDLNDTDGCAKFAEQGRRLGFTGMSTIHPSQVDVVNAAFSPTAAEIDYCRKVVDAFDEGQARGDGAVALGGQMLDLPVVERARRMLALADSLNS
jgi:citrate lyase subunit beta/citryl-CoA lyase